MDLFSEKFYGEEMRPFWGIFAAFCISLEIEHPSFMLAGSMLAFVGSMFYAYQIYQRRHLVEATPTSKIRSTSQGFAEVAGVAAFVGGEAFSSDSSSAPGVVAPLSNRPCIWWRVSVYKERDSRFGWGKSLESSESSNTAVALQDETGSVIFFPVFARMDHFESLRREEDDLIEVEELIYPGQTLYAAGQFKTMSFSAFRSVAWKACRAAEDFKGGSFFSKIRNALSRLLLDSTHNEFDAEPTRKMLRRLESKGNSPVNTLSRSSGFPFIVSARGEAKFQKGLRSALWIHCLAGLAYLGFFLLVFR